MKKRLILLTLVLLGILLVPVYAGAEADPCGEAAFWELSADGVLTISGSGPMTDYLEDDAPWVGMEINSIVISDGITHIGTSAFMGCNASAVHLSDSVESIGDFAFWNCINLKTICFPENLRKIGDLAFLGCSALTELSVPGNTQLGTSAFMGCSKLKTLILGDGITEIAPNAFSGCSQLDKLVLPDSVQSIRQSAFNMCAGLTSVVLPADCAFIGADAFSGCGSIRDVYCLRSEAPQTESGNDSLHSASWHGVLALPEDLTVIGAEALARTNAAKIILPAGILEIQNRAFADSPHLKVLQFTSCIDDIAVSPDYLEGCENVRIVTP